MSAFEMAGMFNEIIPSNISAKRVLFSLVFVVPNLTQPFEYAVGEVPCIPGIPVAIGVVTSSVDRHG